MTAQLLTPVDGGWRVRETEDHVVEILAMAFGNLRIVIAPRDNPTGGYTRGWCYRDDLLVVAARALDFDPDAGGEPVGWVKEAGTERRACAGYISGRREHRQFDPACPDCGRQVLR